MKRAVYEWCGLAFAGLAIGCIAAWVVSRVTSGPTLELSFGYSPQMIAAGGSVTFCDHTANLEVIELVKNSRSFDPAPTAVHAWGIPGFQVDYLGFANGPPMWSLRFSLLLPFVIFLAIGGFCLLRYRIIRRQMSVPTPSVT